jgi:hypothetical protein
MEGELIAPTPTKEKLTATMIARKNCLVLIAKNLKKGSSPEQVEKELRTLIGEKNIVNVYFLRAEAGNYSTRMYTRNSSRNLTRCSTSM